MTNTNEILDMFKNVAKMLGVQEEHITNFLNDLGASTSKKTMVRVGDVIMKDFTVTPLEGAKTRLQDVLGVVFHVNGPDVRIISVAYPIGHYKFKTENTIVSKYLPLCKTEQDASCDMGGKFNSEAIKNAPDFLTEKYPAMGYCMNYSKFGFDKGMWYLPSIGELMQIYHKRDVINATFRALFDINTINDDWYASSSVYAGDIKQCYWVNMFNGEVRLFEKMFAGRVRPCFRLVMDNNI